MNTISHFPRKYPMVRVCLVAAIVIACFSPSVSTAENSLVANTDCPLEDLSLGSEVDAVDYYAKDGQTFVAVQSQNPAGALIEIQNQLNSQSGSPRYTDLLFSTEASDSFCFVARVAAYTTIISWLGGTIAAIADSMGYIGPMSPHDRIRFYGGMFILAPLASTAAAAMGSGASDAHTPRVDVRSFAAFTSAKAPSLHVTAVDSASERAALLAHLASEGWIRLEGPQRPEKAQPHE